MSDVFIVDGMEIDGLYEAYLWLKDAWSDEPYNMWYEETGKKGSEYYRECIYIEPVRGYEDLDDWCIATPEDFREFLENDEMDGFNHFYNSHNILEKTLVS